MGPPDVGPHDVGAEESRLHALLADPHGSTPVGAFFGGPGAPSPARPAHGLGTEVFPYEVAFRCLPTDEVVARLFERFGEAARPKVERWRAMWDEAFAGAEEGLERFAAVTRGEVGILAEVAVRMDRMSLIRRLRDGTATAADAARLYALDEDRAAESARHPSLHALEDAFRDVALADAGVPVTYHAPNRPAYPRPLFTRLTPIRGAPAAVGLADAEDSARLADAAAATPEYWDAPSFRATCRRRYARADDALHASLVLLDMARHGYAKAFVKRCSRKSGTWVVDLTGVAKPNDALVALTRSMGARAVVPDASGMVVQAFTPFVHEHRFFVVGGRVVASTPSDRDLSVLDVASGRIRFDPRVATLLRPARTEGPYERGATTSEEARPLVAAMARAVRTFASRTAADPLSRGLMGEAYVVDVGSNGLDPASSYVDLVEVNAFRNVGLYAVDCDRVARALARHLSDPRREPPVRRDPPPPTDALDGILALLAKAVGRP